MDPTASLDAVLAFGLFGGFILGCYLGGVLGYVLGGPSKSQRHVIRTALAGRTTQASEPEARIIDDLQHRWRN